MKKRKEWTEMKNWFRRMGERYVRMMYGRYGNDELNFVLLIAALVLSFLAGLPHMFFFLMPLSIVLLVWSVYRTYSRRIDRRRREAEVYWRIKSKIKGFFTLRKNKWRDRKTHRYFKCKHCRAVLRVPKGKGMIDVTCPKCGKITVKKT